MWEILVTRYRAALLLALFAVAFMVVAARLWNEQLRRRGDYAEDIKQQSIRRVRIPGARGRIFSADGKLLADNAPSHNIAFHLTETRVPGSRAKQVEHILALARRVGKAIGRPLDLTKLDIQEHMNLRPAIPLTVYRDLTQKELTRAMELSPPIRGMEIITEPERIYPEASLACHVLGYIGKQDPTEAVDRRDYSYYVPDTKGRQGLELELDQDIPVGAGYHGLRGEAGMSLLRVDVAGFTHEDLGVSRPPLRGNDVVLFLNCRAQKIAESLLEDRRGAIVVLNARNGAVLAMASNPGYDLMKFVGGISGKDWKELINDPGKPLRNRATRSNYMPGSIVKPLVGLAALKAGMDPRETVYCDGAARIGKAKIRCWSWKYGGHGEEDLPEAIKDSCNVYFIDRGRKLGLDPLSDMYRAAGFGEKTGLILPESRGVFPSREAKWRRFRSKWTDYDTSLISIGQGVFAITPIQAAVYVAAIANGGELWRPMLIKEILNPNGKTLYVNKPEKRGQLPVTRWQLDVIRDGMKRVVQDRRGTGKRAKTDVIELSGKTGTAQVVQSGEKTRQTWFIGYGEKDGVLYAIVVTVENGVGGGFTCAPIAKTFFERFLAPGHVKKIKK